LNNLTIRELLVLLSTQHSVRNEDHINIIIEILRKRTGENFASNVDKWIEWYLKSLAKEKDKRVVETSYKLFKMNEDIKNCK
jgi:hypothetical protein